MAATLYVGFVGFFVLGLVYRERVWYWVSLACAGGLVLGSAIGAFP